MTLKSRRSGATALEYAVALALIIVIAITAISYLGSPAQQGQKSPVFTQVTMETKKVDGLNLEVLIFQGAEGQTMAVRDLEILSVRMVQAWLSKNRDYESVNFSHPIYDRQTRKIAHLVRKKE